MGVQTPSICRLCDTLQLSKSDDPSVTFVVVVKSVTGPGPSVTSSAFMDNHVHKAVTEKVIAALISSPTRIVRELLQEPREISERLELQDAHGTVCIMLQII